MRSLRLRGGDPGLGGQVGLLGVVEPGAGRPAVPQELLLPPEGEARLGERGLRRREAGLRRAQRVLLVLGVEPGDELARLERVAHVDGPLEDAPVEAEGEAGLVPGADLAGQRGGLALRAALDGDRPDGPGLRRRRRRLVAAGDRRRGDQGGCCDPRRELGHGLRFLGVRRHSRSRRGARGPSARRPRRTRRGCARSRRGSSGRSAPAPPPPRRRRPRRPGR